MLGIKLICSFEACLHMGMIRVFGVKAVTHRARKSFAKERGKNPTNEQGQIKSRFLLFYFIYLFIYWINSIYQIELFFFCCVKYKTKNKQPFNLDYLGILI